MARPSARGKLSGQKKAARIELSSVQRDMGQSVHHLRIVEGSQVHKDLVRNIIQFTGYGKRFPNSRGQIEPRLLGEDGVKRLPVFNGPFIAMVDSFLIERRGGAVFFPVIIPQDAGWEDSFIDFPDADFGRLIWASECLDDQQDIRVGMQVLFETIKNNGLLLRPGGEDLDLENANLVKSFDTQDCFVCGSSTETPPNALVLCKECHCRFHQRCYSIDHIPDGHWYCNTCVAAREQCLKSKVEDGGNEAYDNSPAVQRQSSGKNSKKGKTMRDRSASTASGYLTTSISTANDGDSQPTIPASGAVVEFPAPARTNHQHPQPPATSILPRDRDDLVVLARLKAKNIYRAVDIALVHKVEDFFEACGAAWQMQVKKLYFYLPDNVNGVLEVVAGSRSSFKQAIKMFEHRPNHEKKTVIQVLLLAEGENV